MAQKTGEELLQQQGQIAQSMAYIPSETVSEASATLAEVSAGKPAEYTNEHADQLGGLYDQIINRDPYSYNPMQDSVYMDYRDQYQRMGRQGAQASQRNVNALSGGYGNVWSGAVANQQYGEHLTAMNDIVPALEQNAFNAYQTEGNDLSAKLAATQAQEERDYGRWRDTYTNWAADRSFAQNRAQTAYANDYSRYADNISNVMQVIGYEREDAETLRSNAYSWAITLLNQGIMPTAEIMQAAGIDPVAAEKLYKKKNHSGGGGRRRRGTGSAADTESTQSDTERISLTDIT